MQRLWFKGHKGQRVRWDRLAVKAHKVRKVLAGIKDRPVHREYRVRREHRVRTALLEIKAHKGHRACKVQLDP